MDDKLAVVSSIGKESFYYSRFGQKGKLIRLVWLSGVGRRVSAFHKPYNRTDRDTFTFGIPFTGPMVVLYSGVEFVGSVGWKHDLLRSNLLPTIDFYPLLLRTVINQELSPWVRLRKIKVQSNWR
jgi:hypothetical protein